MVTSSKRAYAIPTPRAPVPAADHCRPVPPQEMLKHNSVPVSVGSLGPWVSQGLFKPSERLWWTSGLILNVNSPLLPSCWGVSFAPGRGVSPHSRSSAYHLAGFSLTVIVGCLHTTIQRSAAAVLDLGRGVSIHSCSSEVQPALLTLDARYLLLAACCSSSVQPPLAAPVT